MNASIYRISLDIQAAYANVSLDVKRGDLGRRIHITLTDGGFPYQISPECYAVFTATKPDGNKVFNHCTIEGNAIIYAMTPQTVAAVGMAECEVKIYGADDQLLTSACFNMVINETVIKEDDQIESETEVDALTHLISEATATITEGKNVNEESRILIDDMEAKREELAKNIADTKSYSDIAKVSSENAKASEQAAGSSERNAKTSETNAKASEVAAKNSETAAKTSETNAKASETVSTAAEKNAKASEENAKISENNAKTSENNAWSSKSKANISELNAKASETNAKASEQAARNSEAAAKSSENNAKASEQAAKNSETAAKTSETNAKTSEQVAKNSETAAKNSEANARASETASKASEKNAKTSEGNAKTSENNAKTSENNAWSSEAEAKLSEANAKIAEENAKRYAEAMPIVNGATVFVQPEEPVAGKLGTLWYDTDDESNASPSIKVTAAEFDEDNDIVPGRSGVTLTIETYDPATATKSIESVRLLNGETSSEAVKYISQNLTEAQKAQARENIGALSRAEWEASLLASATVE